MKTLFLVVGLLISSLAFSAPINYFEAEVGRDDGAILLNGCSKAKEQSAAAAFADCYEAGYVRCEVLQSLKLRYSKSGLFTRGFCLYKTIVRGMDRLQEDRFLFKFAGKSQWGSCGKDYPEVKEFVDRNVLAECLRKFPRCTIVSNRIVPTDFGCGVESVARGSN